MIYEFLLCSWLLIWLLYKRAMTEKSMSCQSLSCSKNIWSVFLQNSNVPYPNDILLIDSTLAPDKDSRILRASTATIETHAGCRNLLKTANKQSCPFYMEFIIYMEVPLRERSLLADYLSLQLVLSSALQYFYWPCDFSPEWPPRSGNFRLLWTKSLQLNRELALI